MKYDSTLFENTAEYYERYRSKYPTKIFNKIVDVFKPTKDDVLLDLGCGTGKIALPLAKYFKKVLLWDPDAEMLKIAKKKAKQQNIINVLFEQKSSDDLHTLTDKIKLVSMGQSFHWMDGETTLNEIKKHLANNSGIAIIGTRYGLHIYSPPFDEPNEITIERNKIVKEVAMKYLNKERKAGKNTFKHNNKPFNDMLTEAGFANIDEITFDKISKRTINETIGFLYSTSRGSKYQLGDKVENFEKELKEKLSKISPNGIFNEKTIFSLLIAK